MFGWFSGIPWAEIPLLAERGGVTPALWRLWRICDQLTVSLRVRWYFKAYVQLAIHNRILFVEHRVNILVVALYMSVLGANWIIPGN